MTRPLLRRWLLVALLWVCALWTANGTIVENGALAGLFLLGYWYAAGQPGGGGNFCPGNPVTRAQMAVFLLVAKYGPGYAPPPATGTLFNDVPANGFAAAWIEQLSREGISGGCGGGNYCPGTAVNRAAMAVFLSTAFRLGLTFLSTDHLGTPSLATVVTGRKTWEGGFEPFGADWNGAQERGVFLRFPGQWVDGGWENAGVGERFFYNVHRWYESKAGRYTKPDPVGLLRPLTHYTYATASPLRLIDPDGRIPKPPGAKSCGADLKDPDITLPKPNCRGCDLEKLRSAATHAQANLRGYCGGGKKCASEEELRTQARGGIDENSGQAWYRPQGDPCVDYCICVHEQDHIRRLFFNPYRDSSCEELECLASSSQLRCLKLSAAGRL